MNVKLGMQSVQSLDSSVPAVRVEGLTKRFDGLVANDDITLDFKRGEVHALLGENGAGKTTLMNLLYGMYRRDKGKVYRNGVEVEIRSSRDAISCGIGMIHQNFMLVSTLGVLDNIVLGLESVGFRIDRKRLSAEIDAVASRYGIQVDLGAKVWQLSVGEQQRVELIKILYRNVDFLILDEPTAVLTPGETKRLFEMMRRITANGGAVVFISHKLEEVMEVADGVSVLRHGRLVGTVERDETNKTELTRMMIGRPIWEAVTRIPSDPKATEVITATNLSCLNEKGLPALRGVSFCIRQGEILGIAGVAGNGQRELLEVLSGLRKLVGGEVWIHGTNLTNKSVRELDAFGVSYVPEDRALFGTIGQFDISENLILNTFWKHPYSAHGLLNRDAITSHCEELVRKYDVRTANIRVSARLLSGGNLQKLILARELDKNPKLLLAGQPTRGLDVGATQYVRNEMIQQKAKGAAILLVSDDLQDILALSDRIAVMYGGRIVGEMTPEDLDLDRLGSMMAGTSRAEAGA
jgi:general nucleoside transport system ATP-binding protein